jgi:hypothetical protein
MILDRHQVDQAARHRALQVGLGLDKNFSRYGAQGGIYTSSGG